MSRGHQTRSGTATVARYRATSDVPHDDLQRITAVQPSRGHFGRGRGRGEGRGRFTVRRTIRAFTSLALVASVSGIIRRSLANLSRRRRNADELHERRRLSRCKLHVAGLGRILRSRDRSCVRSIDTTTISAIRPRFQFPFVSGERPLRGSDDQMIYADCVWRVLIFADVLYNNGSCRSLCSSPSAGLPRNDRPAEITVGAVPRAAVF